MAKNSYERTALHEAASRRHEAVLQLLLETGADITVKGLLISRKLLS
jgi:ankyrin repeat protein